MIRNASTKVTGRSGSSLNEFFGTISLDDKQKRYKEMLSASLEGCSKKESALMEYETLLFAVKEKLRLTVDWNSTSKMTERERVVATARRVGLEASYPVDKSLVK